MDRDEKTLILFKPDCVRKNLSGIILQRLLGEGFRLRGMKMMQLTDEILAQHYAHLVKKPFFPILKASMMKTPVIAMCLEGVDAIAVVRYITGYTNGRKADPGTIRGDYSLSAQENIVHTSDSLENAEIELNRFFVESDYCEYTSPLNPFKYAPDEC